MQEFEFIIQTLRAENSSLGSQLDRSLTDLRSRNEDIDEKHQEISQMKDNLDNLHSKYTLAVSEKDFAQSDVLKLSYDIKEKEISLADAVRELARLRSLVDEKSQIKVAAPYQPVCVLLCVRWLFPTSRLDVTCDVCVCVCVCRAAGRWT